MKNLIVFFFLTSCSLLKLKSDDYIKIGGVDGGHYLKVEELKNSTYKFIILNEKKELLVSDIFTPCEDCQQSIITKKYILKNVNFYDNSGKLYLVNKRGKVCYFISKNFKQHE